eukprot:m.31208 g.31208  ORF g.31208 m.31208 type:complete len:220 (+) comp12047_c0_seq1:70-729(+)
MASFLSLSLLVFCAIMATNAQIFPVTIVFPFADFDKVIGDPLGDDALMFASQLWLLIRNSTELEREDITSIAIRPSDFPGLQATLVCASSQASTLLLAMAQEELCIQMGSQEFCTDALQPTVEPQDTTILPFSTTGVPKKNQAANEFYETSNFKYYAGGVLGGLVLLLVLLLCRRCKLNKETREALDEADYERFKDRVTQQFGVIDRLVASDSLASSVL